MMLLPEVKTSLMQRTSRRKRAGMRVWGPPPTPPPPPPIQCGKNLTIFFPWKKKIAAAKDFCCKLLTSMLKWLACSLSWSISWRSKSFPNFLSNQFFFPWDNFFNLFVNGIIVNAKLFLREILYCQSNMTIGKKTNVCRSTEPVTVENVKSNTQISCSKTLKGIWRANRMNDQMNTAKK